MHRGHAPPDLQAAQHGSGEIRNPAAADSIKKPHPAPGGEVNTSKKLHPSPAPDPAICEQSRAKGETFF